MIERKILNEIKRNGELSTFDIDVEVNEDKVVFLSGEVDNWNQVVAISR